jgi:hypothetical protein
MNDQPNSMKRKVFLCLFLLTLTGTHHFLYAQPDSLILKNKDVIVGELKSMERGVVTLETDYSDSDFKIEWEGIDEIYTTTAFLITLTDGQRFNGTLRMGDDKKILIQEITGGQYTTELNDVVFLKSVDQDFWSRLYASIDLGFSFTKANNLRQTSLRSTIGYLADRWSADGTYNFIYSTQDSVSATRRTDARITYRKFLPKDWYLPVDLSFLSNTEQKLDLRTNTKIGIGKYVIHTNNAYWGIGAGASNVNEMFSSEDPSRNSWEAYFGTELNLYDIGDWSLLTRVTAYPGITESGRWRTDLNFDTNYDLPLDFYIRVGFTLNFDNQPVEGASTTDYIFQTSFGWEW